MLLPLESVQSSLISPRGHDADARILHIRFKKKDALGSLYEYGNVSAALYAEGCNHRNAETGDLSFGQWFQQVIKRNDRTYPFRKLDDGGPLPTETVDCTGGQLLPVGVLTAVEESIPTDPEEMRLAALQLEQRAAAIVGTAQQPTALPSAEAYQLAAVTVTAISRMRAAAECTLRPEIKAKHKVWQEALSVLNQLNNPLEAVEKRLRTGMVQFQQRAEAERRRLQEEARAEQQRIADAEAAEQAAQMQLDDAIEAESRGEIEIAEQIITSKPLPVAAKIVPPVHVPNLVPKVGGISHRAKWEVEVFDESQIPREYLIVDIRALQRVAEATKGRVQIPGVRIYDAGSISVRAS